MAANRGFIGETLLPPRFTCSPPTTAPSTA